MVRALNVQGVQADIVTTNDDGPSLLPVATGRSQVYEGCNVTFLPRWSPSIGALREFQFAGGFPVWLKEALPAYDGLHVHAVFSYLSTRAMMVARRAGKPYIARPLGQLDTWSLKQKALKKRLYYRAVEGRNLLGAAAIHCTSEVEAGNVRILLPQARTAVIAHGVEPASEMANARAELRESLGLPADAKVLLFLSRWHVKKNIPLLLEALAGEGCAPWTLVLAGSAEKPYQEVIQHAIQQHGMTHRVLCPGHVEGAAKARLLQGADAFVLPSESENFGIAVAEALVYGLPVVITKGVDIAPVAEQLQGGYVCDPTVESLRTALAKMLARPADKARLQAEARKVFSWNVTAAKLSTLYHEVFAVHPQ